MARRVSWSRVEFFERVAPFDADRLRLALWKLYARGNDDLRRRIAEQVDPIAREEAKAGRQAQPVDPGFLTDDVNEFCELARAGAYLGGSRRVSPKQRSAWRATFRRLLQDANKLLSQGDVEAGAQALEALLDVAIESSGFHYFRSEDPVAALNLVVSEQVAVLWRTLLSRAGLTGFARTATSQLVRWESPGGWTRHGEKLVDREVPLAQVLDGLLPAGDAWVTLGRAYVDLLDTLAAESRSSTKDEWTARSERSQRAWKLSEWHQVLAKRLAGTEAKDLFQRIARHQALT